MSGTNTQDQTVNGRLMVSGPAFGASTVTGDKGLLTGDGSSPEKFPGVVGLNVDPSVTGKPAELGSLGLNATTGDVWRKFGAGDTQWIKIAGGGASLIGSPLILTPKLQPPALSAGATNDYNPTVSGVTLSQVSVLDLTADVSGSILSGLAAQPAGTVMVVRNLSSTLTLAQESVSSAAVNRFNFPNATSITLGPDEAITLVYTVIGGASTGRWQAAGIAKAVTSLAGLAPFYFGDKADGSATISVDTTAAKDMFYDSLTVNAGVNYNMAGFRLFARTLVNNGRIHNNGGDGVTPVTNTQPAGGVAAGAAFYGGTPAVGRPGSNATPGVSGAPNAGYSWPGSTIGTAAASTGIGNAGGICQGGSGGGVGGAAGSAGGTTVATSPVAEGSPHNMPERLIGRAALEATQKWTGGSGGGIGSCTAASSFSGGSGAGGGVIGVFAQVYSGTGTIEARGGNAGDSFYGGAGGQVNGSGGGGGGVAVVVTGSGVPAVLVNGGNRGLAANGGNNGGSGGAGISYVDANILGS